MKKLFSLLTLVLFMGSLAFASTTGNVASKKWTQTLNTGTIACMQTALEKKEASVKTAFTNYSNWVLAALDTRETALSTARTKTTSKEIKAVVSSAWAGYKTTVAALKKTLLSEKTSAYNTYKTENKACKPTAIQAKIDVSTASSDQQ